jgi:hypothetical protein
VEAAGAVVAAVVGMGLVVVSVSGPFWPHPDRTGSAISKEPVAVIATRARAKL